MINKTELEIKNNWAFDSQITVSICCLTYNHEKFIEECLDGFLKQRTKFAFEILIHDDASTDATQNIIKLYEEKFPNIIKPIYEIENQYSKKIPMNENFNFPRAKGKYIALCEGDDYWIDENKLQMQVDFLEGNPEYGMCYTDFNILNQKNGDVKKSLFANNAEQYPCTYTLEGWIKRAGYVAPMSWCMRKSLSDTYEPIEGSMDGTFVMFAHFLASSKVKCFKKNTTSVYRVLEESASHSKNLDYFYKRERNIFDLQCIMIDKYKLDPKIKTECEKKFYKKFFYVFATLGIRNEIEKSILHKKTPFRVFVFFIVKLKIGRIFIFYLYKFYRYFRLHLKCK